MEVVRAGKLKQEHGRQYELAVEQATAGLVGEAISTYRGLAKLAQEHSAEYERARILAEIGRLCLLSGNTADAEVAFEQAMRAGIPFGLIKRIKPRVDRARTAPEEPYPGGLREDDFDGVLPEIQRRKAAKRDALLARMSPEQRRAAVEAERLFALVRPHINAAVEHERKKRFAEAAKEYQKAIQVLDGEPKPSADHLRAEHTVALGRVLLLMGKTLESEECFRNAVNAVAHPVLKEHVRKLVKEAKAKPIRFPR